MPLVTASSVFAEAQSVYLNDASAVKYTNAVLLPFLKSAYEHLRNELAVNGISVLNEVSAVIDVAAGATGLTEPTDMLMPIKMEERADGSSDLYTPMVEKSWEPDATQTDTLRWWTWREQEIVFLGATTAREVRIYYIKDLDPTSLVVGSTNLMGNARSYLAARIAGLCAMFIMRNEDLAMACNAVAEDQKDKIVKIAVQAQQGLPSRRKPFLGPRRRF